MAKEPPAPWGRADGTSSTYDLAFHAAGHTPSAPDTHAKQPEVQTFGWPVQVSSVVQRGGERLSAEAHRAEERLRSVAREGIAAMEALPREVDTFEAVHIIALDRKSTRLNSSH